MPNLRLFAPLAHSFIDKLIPNWRHPDPHIRVAALGRIKRQARLRKIAATSKDENVLLETGLRLNDHPLLQRLARSAADEQIRLSAAMAVGDQESLCQLALECWDIEQGKNAISHITCRHLLNRIVRDAAQDHLRLEAARKLGDQEAMRDIAYQSCDLELRWNVASLLKDPILLAELAHHHPHSPKSRIIQQKARLALGYHIAELAAGRQIGTLIEFIDNVRFNALKAEAFCKIPRRSLNQRALLVMSRQDLQYIDHDLIEKVFRHIRSAGWQMKTRLVSQTCRHCKGCGTKLPGWPTPAESESHPDAYPCPDCSGLGKITVRVTACQRDNRIVVFKIPQTV